MQYLDWVENVLGAVLGKSGREDGAKFAVDLLAVELDLASMATGRLVYQPIVSDPAQARKAIITAVDELRHLGLVDVGRRTSVVGITSLGLQAAKTSVQQACSWMTGVRPKLGDEEAKFLDGLVAIAEAKEQPELFAIRHEQTAQDVFTRLAWDWNPQYDAPRADNIVTRLQGLSCVDKQPKGQMCYYGGRIDVWPLYAGFVAGQHDAWW